MRSARNPSEQRFYDLLVRTGYDENEIQEPDGDSSLVGTADFMVGDCVFEVKEVRPTGAAGKEVVVIDEELRSGGMTIAREKPDISSQFKLDVKDARKKFKDYGNYATVLVEDLVAWRDHLPNIERLLFGTQAIRIDAASLEPITTLWKNRELHLGKNRGIGSYIFVTNNGAVAYHNLMANNYKMMPVEHIHRFQRVAHEQFIFVNLPSGPPLVRPIM
jgi:hypothetical protein